MNKDKVIKDLKERNRSLNNQYRLRDIRCVCLENKVQEQEKEIERLNKIIGHTLGYIEGAYKVDITYVCKILKGDDKE